MKCLKPSYKITSILVLSLCTCSVFHAAAAKAPRVELRDEDGRLVVEWESVDTVSGFLVHYRLVSGETHTARVSALASQTTLPEALERVRGVRVQALGADGAPGEAGDELLVREHLNRSVLHSEMLPRAVQIRPHSSTAIELSWKRPLVFSGLAYYDVPFTLLYYVHPTAQRAS